MLLGLLFLSAGLVQLGLLTGQLWHFGATHQAHFSEAPFCGATVAGDHFTAGGRVEGNQSGE